ncbi:MAG: FMN-binding protein [Gammaproteobacteria bacterium]|nr:FMN-binding protein [Gammaproteobacteria bacterium]|tara:strand:- start:606 stop:1157 length:552 start_codon:yes stop_codon:yes gene_type:complete
MKLLTASVFLISLMVTLGARVAIAADDPTFELSHQDFLQEVFAGEPPESKPVYIRGELRQQVETILQHRTTFLRTRYWMRDDLSVWILDEIGKDQPITIAVVVTHEQQQSTIEDVEVLAFREPRGWEVRHDFFTDQFRGAGRDASGRGLDTSIDGITGATLSVRALRKVAEIALLLDEHVRQE